jgi:3-oxoadipate enol-lactonase
MPAVQANGIHLHYDREGSGEPLVLLPYLAADRACYTFQAGDYARHFTCYSLDLRGCGDSDKPAGPYSVEQLADDVAAFMQAAGLERAHVAGGSLGAAVGMWLAAKHPERVKSLALHSAWGKTDEFLRAVLQSWQCLAKMLNDVAETVVMGVLPWYLSHDLYTAQPDFVASLTDFVRSRPAQPVEAFLAASDALLAHDAEAQLHRIQAPTQITFGRNDRLTSQRIAERLAGGIPTNEVVIFDGCAHAPMYECAEEFNRRTLAFLRAYSG